MASTKEMDCERTASACDTSGGVSPLTFRCVSDFRELDGLAPAWHDLLLHSSSAEPMQSPTWLLTWWRIYGQGSERTPHVGLFYERDQLVGLVPLCRRRFRYLSFLPLIRLEFFGADVDEGDGVCSEFLNLIVRAGYEDRVARAFAQQCRRGSFGSWHEIVLASMNGEAVLPGHLLKAFQETGYPCDLHTTTEAPYLRRPESWEAYLHSLNANKRRYLLTAWRRSRPGQETSGASKKSKGRILCPRGRPSWRLCTITVGRRGPGLTAQFRRPRFAAFHHVVLPQLLAEGRLQLFWLVVRDEPIAVSYEIHANQKVYLYQSGRKTDVPPAIRPGIILTMLAVQEAIAQGFREYDFLGWPSQYKAQFTKTTRPLVALRIAHSCPREWLRRGASAALAWARRLRNSLGRTPSAPR